jgi:hypothetical protein
VPISAVSLAICLSLALSFRPGVTTQNADQAALNEELWNAARAGDAARVVQALDKGADINSGNRYKAGALFFAADRGHLEVVKLLLDRGANVNTQDTFYKFRPIVMALMNDHFEVVKLMLEGCAAGNDGTRVEGSDSSEPRGRARGGHQDAGNRDYSSHRETAGGHAGGTGSRSGERTCRHARALYRQLQQRCRVHGERRPQQRPVDRHADGTRTAHARPDIRDHLQRH